MRKVIKETKYCQILNQGKIFDGEYTCCIEKAFIKEKAREEIRFTIYKDTVRGEETYIPRSLDVTEKELLELIKIAIKNEVFSKDFISQLGTITSQNKSIKGE